MIEQSTLLTSLSYVYKTACENRKLLVSGKSCVFVSVFSNEGNVLGVSLGFVPLLHSSDSMTAKHDLSIVTTKFICTLLFLCGS